MRKRNAQRLSRQIFGCSIIQKHAALPTLAWISSRHYSDNCGKRLALNRHWMLVVALVIFLASSHNLASRELLALTVAGTMLSRLGSAMSVHHFSLAMQRNFQSKH